MLTNSNYTTNSRIVDRKSGEVSSDKKTVYLLRSRGYTVFHLLGNTARPAANASAHHLLASFPSYYPNSP